MCNEFFLACLYLFVVFIINFFLYKLLKNYINNIIISQKLKRILTIYPNNEFFIKLYQYSLKEFKNQNSLEKLKFGNSSQIDSLIIGNIYKYISLNNRNSKDNYYFSLLEKQYLPF
jgi:hypothetical protein